MNQENQVCILFSGGSDSTLTAASLAQEFKKIHLLTFKFYGVVNPEKSTINLERLKRKYADVEFIYRIIDTEEFFMMFYYKNFLRDLLKFGLYVENICLSCKLAMFAAAADYCFKNGIELIASGANKKSGLVFADQKINNIEILNNCFNKYGIKYLTPTYEKERTDWLLYDLGITPVRDVKFPSPEAYKEQPGCFYGMMHSIFVHGYFLPLYGSKRYFKLVDAHFQEKLKELDLYLSKLKKQA